MQMSFEQDAPLPEDPSHESLARRRRAKRSLIPDSDVARAAVLENLARRAFPSFEFFLFSLLCGAILGAGYIFDSPSILLLGILLSPLMAPWVGIALAAVTGSGRFFVQTLAGFFISIGLVFFSSYLAGAAARVLPPQSVLQATIHSHLWWTDLLVVVLGSVLLIVSFVRSEQRPILPSVILTYELFLPLSSAGFGLGSGLSNFWPNGILVFCVHLALATLVGLLTLVFVGFRPRRLPGYFLSLTIGLLALVIFIWLSGIGSGYGFPGGSKTPSVTASDQATPVVTQNMPVSSASPQANISGTVEPSSTATQRIPITVTPTITLTPEATPIYARIFTENGLGAYVRQSPGSATTILVALVNDSLVQILPETQVLNGDTWQKIRTSAGIEGWIIRSLMATATPG
jgi:hypothetical protein